MSDLRAPLIETAAQAFYEADDCYRDSWESQPEKGVKDWYRRMAGVMLDSSLGFLTDNWPKTGNDIEDALMLRVGRSSDRTIETCITTFLAALSDGRDTGEKEN